MNYYAHKAYFAALELEALQRELTKASKRKEYKRLDVLMAQYDKLAAEFNNYDIQARARLTVN